MAGGICPARSVHSQLSASRLNTCAFVQDAELKRGAPTSRSYERSVRVQSGRLPKTMCSVTRHAHVHQQNLDVHNRGLTIDAAIYFDDFLTFCPMCDLGFV